MESLIMNMQSDFEKFLNQNGKSDVANLKCKKLIDSYEMETAALLSFHFSYPATQRYLLSPMQINLFSALPIILSLSF